MHKYTIHSDDPDFIRAKINAQQISDVRHCAKHPKHKLMIYNPESEKTPLCDIKKTIFVILFP